ncbi:MAG: c-type cytochrome, partial [Verrucomicrobia bacterium]|nr:c-type cytochrome [Cytophagales bacterium]
HHNTDKQAPELWAKLAEKYDGKDRWYLEALGIGDDNQWDTFFDKWLLLAGDKWKNTQAGKDIVWRSRATKTSEKLAELIALEKDMKNTYRYFRAFDFQQAEARTAALFDLLEKDNAVALLALKHADPKIVQQSAIYKETVPRILAQAQDTADYLDLVNLYQMKDQNQKLLALASTDNSFNKEATDLLIKSDGGSSFQKMLSQGKAQSIKAMQIFGRSEENVVKEALKKIFMNANQDLALRQMALKKFGGTWNGEEKLLALVKNKQIPKDLETTASTVFITVWRQSLRKEAAKYLKMTTPEGKELPPVTELVKGKGNPANGLKVMEMYCYTCHQVGNKGNNFGPALSEIGSKLPAEGLYNAILYPDAGVSMGYEGYKIMLKDGNELQGIVSSKTEAEVEIKLPGGTVQKIKRAEVAAMEVMHNSMMPQFPLSQNELTDLVAYLSTLKRKEQLSLK